MGNAWNTKDKSCGKFGSHKGDQTFLELAKGYLILIGHNAIDGGFKKVEKGKPDPCSVSISLVKGSIICQGMVVEKQTSAYVKSNKNID